MTYHSHTSQENGFSNMSNLLFADVVYMLRSGYFNEIIM